MYLSVYPSFSHQPSASRPRLGQRGCAATCRPESAAAWSAAESLSMRLSMVRGQEGSLTPQQMTSVSCRSSRELQYRDSWENVLFYNSLRSRNPLTSSRVDHEILSHHGEVVHEELANLFTRRKPKQVCCLIHRFFRLGIACYINRICLSPSLWHLLA